jgi:ribosomal protein L31E
MTQYSEGYDRVCISNLDIVPRDFLTTETESCTQVYNELAYTEYLSKRSQSEYLQSTESRSHLENENSQLSLVNNSSNTDYRNVCQQYLLDIMKDNFPSSVLLEEEFKTSEYALQLTKASKARADSKYKAVLSTVKRFMMKDIKNQDKRLRSTNPAYYHKTLEIRHIILANIIGPVSDARCQAIWDISQGPTLGWQNWCTDDGTDTRYLEYIINLLKQNDHPVQKLYFEEKICKSIEVLVNKAADSSEGSYARFHALIQEKLQQEALKKPKSKFPMTVAQFENAVAVTIEKLISVVKNYKDAR